MSCHGNTFRGCNRYALVGAQILTTILLNMVMPFAPLLLTAIGSCCLPLASRGAVTQVRISHAIPSPRHNIRWLSGKLALGGLLPVYSKHAV